MFDNICMITNWNFSMNIWSNFKKFEQGIGFTLLADLIIEHTPGHWMFPTASQNDQRKCLATHIAMITPLLTYLHKYCWAGGNYEELKYLTKIIKTLHYQLKQASKEMTLTLSVRLFNVLIYYMLTLPDFVLDFISQLFTRYLGAFKYYVSAFGGWGIWAKILTCWHSEGKGWEN